MTRQRTETTILPNSNSDIEGQKIHTTSLFQNNSSQRAKRMLVYAPSRVIYPPPDNSRKPLNHKRGGNCGGSQGGV
jgi:hypothetical protein